MVEFLFAFGRNSPLLISYIDFRDNYQGTAEEVFQSTVLDLWRRYPDLSINQIVSSQFAIHPQRVRVANLTTFCGITVDFQGRPKVESERRVTTNGYQNRSFVIIPDESNPAFVYVYEITGETDPSRGWCVANPNYRGAKRYIECNTPRAKATFFAKFHHARYCERDEIAEGNRIVTVATDLTEFTDPSDGLSWTPADLNLPPFLDENRRLSWLHPKDGSVAGMLATRSRIVGIGMKNANRSVSNNLCHVFIYDTN